MFFLFNFFLEFDPGVVPSIHFLNHYDFIVLNNNPGLIENSFDFDIEGINESSYAREEEIMISVESTDRDDDEISSMQVFVNNAFVQTDNNEPFEVTLQLSELQYLETENIIRVILTDKEGIKSIKEKTFTLN